MTAPAMLPSPVGLPARAGVSFGRVVASEWFKYWGLRSTRGTFTVAVLLTPVLAFIGGSDPNVPADGYGTLAYYVTGLVVITQFPLLLLGVLGGGELSGRSAAPTFTAVPTRTPALLAKALVATTTSAIAALSSLGLAAVVTLATGLGRALSTALTAETTRMWLGTLLYLVAATMFCFGLGLLLRRTTVAVLVAFVVFILDLATISAPGATFVTVLLPGHAAGVVTSTDDFLDMLHEMGSPVLGPWLSVAITAGWAGAVLVGALIRVRGRDV